MTISKLTQNDHNWNLFLNVLHEMCWGFGMVFHSSYAIIPLFLKQLNAPNIIIGSVAGVFVISAAVPQIYSAYLARNTRNIKLTAIGVHLLIIPPIFIAGFIFAFIGPTGPFAWIFYYICFLLFTISVGFIFPIWADFLDSAHLPERRGSFFGISFAFGAIAGVIGGLVVKKLLATVSFPQNFGYGFLIYTCCIIFAVLLFTAYRISNASRQSHAKTFGQFVSEVKNTFLQDTNFKRYIFSRIFLTANFPAISLYAVHSYNKLHFDVSEAGIFAIIIGLTAALSNYVAGKIGDWLGHKYVMVLVFIAYLSALITDLLAHTLTHVYIIFVFLGLAQGGFWTSAMSLIYELAGEKDKKIYFALVDTLTAPFVLIFILLTGAFIPVVGISITLLGLGIFIVIGVLCLAFVTKEPKTIRINIIQPLHK